jgi:hypothetical protein
MFAALLAGAAATVPSASAAATVAASTGSAAASSTAQTEPEEIIIIAPPVFRDLRPERQLDQQAIAGYGVSTVDDLLNELSAELGEDEEPIIIVNGERINSANGIAGLPVELLRSVEVLPRGSAVRAGGRSGQRVFNLTLARQFRALTATIAPTIATEGNWRAGRGEAIFTHVRGTTRANVSLRNRLEGELLESDREIIQPDSRLPFAIGGNIVPFPNGEGEIDPLLSAAAGRIVTVAPLPTNASPSLGDFLSAANQPTVTDMGEFRTLRPRSRNHDLNASFNTRLASWLTSTASLRLTRNLGRSRRGLPSAQFILREANPASPFSRDVGLAVFGREPLISRSQRDSGEANVTLNGTLGAWMANFNVRHAQSKDVSRSERATQFGSVPLENSVNPFTTDLSDRIAITDDRASGRSVLNQAQLSLTGSVSKLPAGDLLATVEGRVSWNTLRSRSTFSPLDPTSRFRRAEQAIRGGLEIPIARPDAQFLPALGDLSATAEYGLQHVSDAGTFDYHSAGLTWEPRPFVRLRGAIETTERAPSVQLLGNPVFISPDVRTFDPLTGGTADVVQISGGNADLRAETTKVRRLTSLFKLVPRLNLQLNAEYTDTDTRNFVSSLPESSAAVMLAFPERFVRDANGVLTTIDLRPVNFESQRQKRLRYGFSLNAPIGGGSAPVRVAAPQGDDQADDAPDRSPPPRLGGGGSRRSPRVQLTANHSIVFEDEIRIRSGLDPVDLLGGGAIGIAGGRVRHQFDGTAGINRGQTGARFGLSWRGKSTLESRISGQTEELRFSPLLLVNLRAFTDAGELFGRNQWARGTRLSLNVVNLLNDRQEVRDPRRDTPLQYQPGYRDPIGRTVELELRKVF